MDDKKGTTSLSVALLLLAIVTWPGCMPARIPSGIKPAVISLEGIHTLAVLKLDGPFGKTVQSHIRNRLKEVQHFRPIDTAQVHALAVVTHGGEDSPQFYFALKKLGADGVISGRVNDSVRDIHGTDQMQVTEGTGHYKKEKNVYGEWVDVEIKRTVVRPVPYIVRQASLDAEYKVFDVNTRQIITTGMVRETYSEKFGGEKECGPFGHKLSDLPTPDGTVDELAASIATKLVTEITRMKLARIIKLDEGGNGMVKDGVELAKTGSWEKAVEIWEQVIHDEPGNVAAYYNLGMAHESVGDVKSLEMARELYKKAISHGDKKLYRDAIARIQRAIGQVHDD